jgi:hypothetical protein
MSEDIDMNECGQCGRKRNKNLGWHSDEDQAGIAVCPVCDVEYWTERTRIVEKERDELKAKLDEEVLRRLGREQLARHYEMEIGTLRWILDNAFCKHKEFMKNRKERNEALSEIERLKKELELALHPERPLRLPTFGPRDWKKEAKR